VNDLNIEERFVVLLRRELDQRLRSNQKYSMRAFAKYLGVEASALSKILSRKRKLSPDKRSNFAQALGWDAKTLFPGIDEHGTTAKFRTLDHDREELITTWYHYALLELARTASYIPSPLYIAKSLGISRHEAKEALLRLQRLNLLRSDGKLMDKEERTSTVGSIEISKKKLRDLQKHMLEKAISALDLTPENERDQSTMVMAIPSNLLNEAKEELKKFRRKFCSTYDHRKDVDRVYHLSISFYPVSKRSLDKN
jgi:uncharacterized protein (TIGR02147 family)